MSPVDKGRAGASSVASRLGVKSKFAFFHIEITPKSSVRNLKENGEILKILMLRFPLGPKEKHLRPGGGCARQKKTKAPVLLLYLSLPPSLSLFLPLFLFLSLFLFIVFSPYLSRSPYFCFFQNTLGNRKIAGVPFLSADGNVLQRTHGN